MDDVKLACSELHVAQVVEVIHHKGRAVGLQLNDKKCEFISKSAASTNLVAYSGSLFVNFNHWSVEEAELLGAPLTAGNATITPV